MVWMKMIQKRTCQLLLATIFLLSSSSSVFSGIGFRSDLTLVSRYIWRGFDTISNNRPAIQPSFALDFGKSGLWLNLWSAIALADTDFVELDLIAGYDKTLSDKITFSAGLGYFTFPSIPGWPDENSATPEVYLGVTASSFPLSPALTFYYDFNLGDGLYTTLSLNRNFHIRGQILCPTLAVGYTRQYQKIGVDPGFSDICLGLSTDFSFKNFSVSPCLNYVIVPNHSINNENEFWVGFTISWLMGGSTDETD
jgi:uncharacterized protein (TIGR02001 family)